MSAAPRIVVFDSGLGGLTVLREVRLARPDAEMVYLADTAAFPYGARADNDVVERVVRVFTWAARELRPDLAVIACNTASTLVLPHLRARFGFPFVGTVPAIKPAASTTRSGRVSVLATPGTVKRDYTRALIDTYASHIDVTLVGAVRLASLAEAALRGEGVRNADISAEIGPAFIGRGARRTDTVVLACTHYPLLSERLRSLAPWPVTWIDPAPAIAARVSDLIAGRPVTSVRGEARALFTASRDNDRLGPALATFGIAEAEDAPIGAGEV